MFLYLYRGNRITMFENNVNNKQKLQFQAMSPGQAQGPASSDAGC